MSRERYYYDGKGVVRDENQLNVAVLCGSPDHEVGALLAAAPELFDALNGLRGLLQLISGREDVTPELREVLRTNHRVQEAERVIFELAVPARPAEEPTPLHVEVKDKATITITREGEVQVEGHFKSFSQELYSPPLPVPYERWWKDHQDAELALRQATGINADVSANADLPVLEPLSEGSEPSTVECWKCGGAGELSGNDHGGDPEWDYATPCPECAPLEKHTLADFHGHVIAYDRYVSRHLKPKCSNGACVRDHGHEGLCSHVPAAASEDFDNDIPF